MTKTNNHTAPKTYGEMTPDEQRAYIDKQRAISAKRAQIDKQIRDRMTARKQPRPQATPTASNPDRTAYTELLQRVCAEYDHDPTAQATVQAITALAQSVAYSIIRKCSDPQRKTDIDKQRASNSGCNPSMIRLHNDLSHALHMYRACDNANAQPAHITYNKDGDPKITTDSGTLSALDEYALDSVGDGYDIVQAACLAIWSALQAQAERDPDKKTDLQRHYTARKLTAHVVRYDTDADDIAQLWADDDRVPIVDIYRHVRRYIGAQSPVNIDPRNTYSYIDDVAHDPDTGALDVIYRRAHKCADIGGYTVTDNGAVGVYTVDMDSADNYYSTIHALGLTAAQLQVLRLRMRPQGYGYKAIAADLHITPHAVAKTVQRIQRKALDIGLLPRDSDSSYYRQWLQAYSTDRLTDDGDIIP